MLLLYIQVMFHQTGRDRFFSRTIVETINEFDDRPWEEERKGKPIDELWLARQLSVYGIRPRTLWSDGVSGRGYYRKDFEDVFGRYLPSMGEKFKEWLEKGRS